MREMLAPLRPLNHSQTQLGTLRKDQQQVPMVTFFPCIWAFLANVLEVGFLWDFLPVFHWHASSHSLYFPQETGPRKGRPAHHLLFIKEGLKGV